MRLLVAAALGAAGLFPSTVRQTGEQLALRAVRFYRADHHRTRVTAFLEIPYAVVDSSGSAYQVAFRITDSIGATVGAEAWKATVPAQRHPGPCVVETVEFLVSSGRYRLEATVKNVVTGRESRSAIDLEAFDRQPTASDLLLSPAIRLASAGDTVPQPGELRRGGALVTAAALPRLGPTRTTAHYLLEVYSAGEKDDAGTMSVWVEDGAGGVPLRWRPVPVQVRPGGSTLHGHVSLVGLAPGRYSLVVSVDLAGRTDQRRAEFVMEGENNPGEQ
ncbi:MAG TPA: hypothetical protein VIE46_06975 [Gemmatimonadales bacterium]